MSILKKLMMLTLVLGTFDVSVHFAQEAEAVDVMRNQIDGYSKQMLRSFMDGGTIARYLIERLTEQGKSTFSMTTLKENKKVELEKLPIISDDFEYVIRDYLMLPAFANSAYSTDIGNVVMLSCKTDENDAILIIKKGDWRNTRIEWRENVYTVTVENIDEFLRNIISTGTYTTDNNKTLQVKNNKIVSLFAPKGQSININMLNEKGYELYFVGLNFGQNIQIPLTHAVKWTDDVCKILRDDKAVICEQFRLNGIRSCRVNNFNDFAVNRYKLENFISSDVHNSQEFSCCNVESIHVADEISRKMIELLADANEGACNGNVFMIDGIDEGGSKHTFVIKPKNQYIPQFPGCENVHILNENNVQESLLQLIKKIQPNQGIDKIIDDSGKTYKFNNAITKLETDKITALFAPSGTKTEQFYMDLCKCNAKLYFVGLNKEHGFTRQLPLTKKVLWSSELIGKDALYIANSLYASWIGTYVAP